MLLFLLSKIFKESSKKIYFKLLKKFKINFFRIDFRQVTARIIAIYLKCALNARYSV
jgi:hypothetical protein